MKETYPSGRVVTTGYNGANQPSSVTGLSPAGRQTSYVAQTFYWPHGAPYAWFYGNNVVPVQVYNSRLQTGLIYATNNNNGNTTLLIDSLDWGSTNNNGTLRGASVQAGGPGVWGTLPTYNVSYAYDALNRIKAASDTGWSRNFGYDENGNMWLTGNAGVAVAGNTPTSNIFDGNNRMAGNSYDASGNQLTVNGNSIYYDAENRQIAVSEALALGGASERYQYDGFGQRVERSTPSGSWVSVYDAFGQLAAEYSDVATNATPCGTCYLTYDHLGSVRLVTDENGLVVSRHDYLPYGEEIAAGVGGRSSQFGAADNTRPRFTGQERDADTGEDYFHARMYGSALGRFTSPDPGNAGADPNNPQTWNAYSYALGSPLVYTDPNGTSITSILSDIGSFFSSIGSSIYTYLNPPCGSDFCVTKVDSGNIDNVASGIAGGISGGGGIATYTATGLGKADVPTVSTPPTNGTNKGSVCFAQLKSRPVNDSTASKVNALHTFWWVQGSSGQRVISGGPFPPSGSNQHLTVWVNPNLYQGPDTPSAHLVFNSGLSSGACGQVDSIINAGQAFPNGSLMYDPVWGPNSNTAAKYFGDVGGFKPSFPFNAYQWNAPLLVPRVP